MPFYQITLSITRDKTILTKIKDTRYLELERASANGKHFFVQYTIHYRGNLLNIPEKRRQSEVGKKFRTDTKTNKRPNVINIEWITSEQYDKIVKHQNTLKSIEPISKGIQTLGARGQEWERKYREMEQHFQRERRENIAMRNEMLQMQLMIQDLKQELREEREKQCKRYEFIKGDDVEEPDSSKACNVCLTNRKTHTLIPCGHMVCGECGEHYHNNKDTERCPICRDEYLHVQRIFTNE